MGATYANAGAFFSVYERLHPLEWDYANLGKKLLARNGPHKVSRQAEVKLNSFER